MIALRTEREIDILREANQIVAEVLATLADAVLPGVTTGELDELGEALIRRKDAVPSFLGYRGYPKATCISVEDVIVHGIPGARRINEGEIVSIDVGALYKGYHGDAAITVPCGPVDSLRQRLIRVTDQALAAAIATIRSGVYLQEVSRAIQETCEAEGFSVVRVFVGHGIGRQMHEDPQIPNFVSGERGPKLKAGMVLAIEPMVNAGTADVRVLKDMWTAVTADGKPSAHFEHSVVVRQKNAEILSTTPKRAWGQGVLMHGRHG
ncbi:MAG: type I methionyl aminopeptidase [Candidatus Hydrogenedentes bacterium]|nr:type I methionyl aminopeptidase [Candidatus Hydrogenedentota bacterium]